MDGWMDGWIHNYSRVHISIVLTLGLMGVVISTLGHDVSICIAVSHR